MAGCEDDELWLDDELLFVPVVEAAGADGELLAVEVFWLAEDIVNADNKDIVDLLRSLPIRKQTKDNPADLDIQNEY